MTFATCHVCPICGSDGFTVWGLELHRCNGINRKTGKGILMPRRRLTWDEKRCIGRIISERINGVEHVKGDVS